MQVFDAVAARVSLWSLWFGVPIAAVPCPEDFHYSFAGSPAQGRAREANVNGGLAYRDRPS